MTQKELNEIEEKEIKAWKDYSAASIAAHKLFEEWNALDDAHRQARYLFSVENRSQKLNKVTK